MYTFSELQTDKNDRFTERSIYMKMLSQVDQIVVHTHGLWVVIFRYHLKKQTIILQCKDNCYTFMQMTVFDLCT